MTEYWTGMYMCHRKGFCHVTAQQCLETHDVQVCGRCEHFVNILAHEEKRTIEETMRRIERQELAPTRRRTRA